MKKSQYLLSLLVFCSVLLSGSLLAQGTVDSTTTSEDSVVATMPVETAPTINVSGVDFSVFKNDKEENGDPLKVGKTSLKWKKAEAGLKSHYVVRYRVEGAEEWKYSKKVSTEKTKVGLTKLKENKYFDWQVGTLDEGDENSNAIWSADTFKFHTLSSSLFVLTKGKGKTTDAAVKGTMLASLITSKRAETDSVIIMYNSKNGAKYKYEKWKYIGPVEVTDKGIKHEFKEIIDNEQFIFKIGVPKDGNAAAAITLLKAEKEAEVIWSKKDKFETERAWGLIKILILIGALGFFIYGMKIMSEGIQKSAGSKLRQILGAMTSNRVKGIFTGFLTTSLVQSSSATTVMVVSFVNAGLLTLVQSIGVIMGANIGTTVTAWLISIFGFKVNIAAFALPIIAIGLPLLFAKRSKMKSWGEVLIGFAILFMGLAFLKDSVPDLKANPEALEFLKGWSGTGLHHILLAILIGTILTVVVQSSSAAMAITLILCDAGFIEFEMAAGMVLGENIGTTITANLAALIGNVHAKRAARAHFIFNIFGVIWMIFAFKFFIMGIDTYMQTTAEGSPIDNPEARPIALSIFHTTFNILNVLMLMWFVNLIAKIVIKMVPSRGEADEEFRLEYIGGNVLSTPDLAIIEAKKEVAKFGKLTSRMSDFTRTLLTSSDNKEKDKLLKKIKKYEEITDRVEIEIADYLGKVTQGDMTETASKRTRSMLSITNDLERIGDIFFQVSKAIERKNDAKIYFLPEQRENLMAMLDLVDKAFVIMVENLNSDSYDGVSLNKAREAETDINTFRNKLRKQHLSSIEKGDYNMVNGMVYNDIFSSFEKVGDHIINVTEAVTGEI
jgi:phosphate:Na+ symporter